MSRASGCLLVLVGLIASCSIGKASTISFSGSFIFDDDVQFFSYQSTTGGLVSISTSSFADGGFAPILALYDASGTQLFYADGVANNDCAVANQADVLGTGYCYDASVTWDSLANTVYYVAISQYANFPIADIAVNQPVNWSSSFQEFGNNYFTAQSSFG